MRAPSVPPLLLLLLLACTPHQTSASLLCGVGAQGATRPLSGGVDTARRVLAETIRLRTAPRRAGEPLGLLSGLSVPDDKQPAFAVGQRVRVATKTRLMHVPGQKKGFNAEGALGSVLKVYDEPNLSANRKIKVELQEPDSKKRYIAHFEAGELTRAEDE